MGSTCYTLKCLLFASSTDMNLFFIVSYAQFIFRDFLFGVGGQNELTQAMATPLPLPTVFFF